MQCILIPSSLSAFVGNTKVNNSGGMHTLNRKIKSCVSFVRVSYSCKKMIPFCIKAAKMDSTNLIRCKCI